MTTIDLKNRILTANQAYRAGRPIMTDQDFDDLCEAYEKLVPAAEYAAFRDSLHEETGKVKHPFVMGSLDKIKAEEPAEVEKWLDAMCAAAGKNAIHVSAKIDGISCRLHYDENGVFVSATTRGDGYAGVDCTDKVRKAIPPRTMVVKGIPFGIGAASVKIPTTGLDIRGELVIKDADFKSISNRFANPRNACAGIINQKDADESLLGKISFIAYEIMGGTLTKFDQFVALKALGFEVPWHTDMGRVANITPMLTNLAKRDFGYPTDGLVLSSPDYRAENKYRPDMQKAFKINALRAESVLVGIDWGTPSKDGRLVPVAEIQPISVGGSTISRVTLNNLDWIKKMDLRLGSKVTVVRSGDVIPKIVDVQNVGGERDIVLPKVCPVCGAPTTVDGPHLRCTNAACKARKAEEVLAFIIKLGIQRIKANTLAGWNVGTFNDLVNFNAAGKGKMGAHFESELQRKLWTADEETIFKALPFTDLAETTLDKIIKHYGWANVKQEGNDTLNGYLHIAHLNIFNAPAGVGTKTMNSFLGQLGDAMRDFNLITKSPRYANKTTTSAPVMATPVAATATANTTTTTGGTTTMATTNNTTVTPGENGSICFTGALNSMTRSVAQEMARNAGFEVKTTVSAGLDYLVTNDPNSGSTKNRKAQRYGTRIITEEEFLMLVG